MTAYLIWDEGKGVEVGSIEEMDRVIDQLSAEAMGGRPFVVILELHEGRSMAMVVGWEESHVEFFDANSRPPIISCQGTWLGEDGDELIVFAYMGHFSELPKRYFIPVDEARDGLRQFFRTGERPTNIKWG